MNARAVAADIIRRWLCEGVSPVEQLAELDLKRRSAVLELVNGVVRWKRKLEWFLDQVATRRPRRSLRAFLLLGIYELLFMDWREIYACVNEIVELVKRDCSLAEAGFVNAALRKLMEESETLVKLMEREPLGIIASHPDLLIERWVGRFGESAAKRLCDWNNARSHVTIKVNGLKIRPEQYYERLLASKTGVLCEEDLASGWLTLERGVAVPDLPGYETGLFGVLDRAAGLSVELLDPRPDEKILDACAAPGGKSFLIAERMEKKGFFTVMDLSRQRLGRLRENLARLGLDDFVNMIIGDASRLIPAADEGYDGILLDVPCSNTGVIRRKPDVKWRFSEETICRLNEVQVNILESGFNSLRSGGRLVYSTCSLEQDENEWLVKSFLGDHPEASLAAEKTLFPPDSGTDGAYATLIYKK